MLFVIKKTTISSVCVKLHVQQYERFAINWCSKPYITPGLVKQAVHSSSTEYGHSKRGTDYKPWTGVQNYRTTNAAFEDVLCFKGHCRAVQHSFLVLGDMNLPMTFF